MSTQNCWEFKNCGREPGGENAEKLGVCPTPVDTSFNGINSGRNAGRICWAIAGTFCNGEEGSFAEKRSSCTHCAFFKLVQTEEGISRTRKFLSFITEGDKSPILDGMTLKRIKAGERFITQGEIGDTAYIIQNGSCLVIVEKDGELYPVNHYGEGDIVGGVGILTGEPRLAHVEAETDMDVWVLKKALFEDISKKDPELLNFMTELVADRFDTKRPMAYREIGKYIATDIIGRGAYSIVYKGVHKSLNMPAAIKMMRHHMAMDPDFLNNFHNEAKIIANLNHENIVKVYDIEERFRTVFIIMEYIHGESLKDMLIHLNTIPPLLTAQFLAQICFGLSYAHRHGIIHRDINLTNILVQRDDHVKILDFGLACPIGTEDINASGTVLYMPPEQIEGNAVDERTDIYSLGISAYEMVTGQRPFPEDDIGALMDMHINQDIPDPSKIISDLPEPLRKFILKACRRDPMERYQNANQALQELQPLVKDFEPIHKETLLERRKTTTLLLTYREEHQLALNRLMEEFTDKAQNLGVDLQVADYHDI